MLAALAMLAMLGRAPGSAGTLTLQAPSGSMEISRTTGAIVAVRESAAGGSIAASDPAVGLWRLGFRGGSLTANEALAGGASFAIEPVGAAGAHLAYSCPDARVQVDVAACEGGFAIRTTVTPARQDVLTVACPAGFAFDAREVNRVVFPSDLGIALKRGFFERQRAPTDWRPTPVGPDALRRCANLTCSLRPMDAKPAPLTVTGAGAAALGPDLTREWNALSLRVTRPAERAADIDLVSSSDGSYLGGHRVGEGLLVRFSGTVPASVSDLAIDSSARVLASLRRGIPGIGPRPDRRRDVILLSMRGGPVTGGWSEAPVADWRRAFARSGAIANAGLRIREVDSVAAMLAALGSPDTFAVVNPYGEGLPVDAMPWADVCDAVHAYLQAGGIWLESGGYPFFMALRPSPYLRMETGIPTGFSDFAHVESSAGRLAVFGVQDARPRDAIYVPATWSASGGASGCLMERRWDTFIRGGGTWAAPPVHLLIGAPAETAASIYADRSRFSVGLERKVRADVLDKWKRSVLVNITGPTFADQMRALDGVPAPAVIHLSDYLHGGFDKQLPDLLPPNDARGGAAGFRALLDRIHESGHLAAPYTNPTWWCDDPRGPTFLRVGEAPLLRRPDGRPNREAYGDNWGWSVCPWHPEVIAAAERMWQPFVTEYPADILFEDQIGMRGLLYDTNPAEPTPYAYVQGIANLSRATAERFPVACEHGFDRLIDIQSQFRGLTWQLVPFERTPPWLQGGLRLYRDWIPDDSWEAYPLAQLVTRGRVLFGHHGGGPFVDTREQLAWTLALGFQMSVDRPAATLSSPEADQWLAWLDRIQKTVGCAYAGQPMATFRYLRGSGSRGVIESTFDGGVRIIANLTDSPWQDADNVIAPMGFGAWAPGVEAGIFRAYRGRRYAPDLWIVHGSGHDGESVSVLTRIPVEVAAAGSSGTMRLAPDTPALRTATRRIARVGIVDAPAAAAWLADGQTTSADRVEAALRRSPEVAAGRVTVARLKTADALAEALRDRAGWLVVNPLAEHLPAGNRPGETLDLLRGFVRSGGIWLETGGYPFFYATEVRGGVPDRTPLGWDGLRHLGLSGCELYRPGAATPVRPTEAGARWLGREWAEAAREASFDACRPPLRIDYDVVLAETVLGAPVLIGHSMGGSGWMLRFCGSGAGDDLMSATLAALVTRAMAEPAGPGDQLSVPPTLCTVTLPRAAPAPQG